MRERILAELHRIEREERVRVLLAVESGSRAWGFASPDSDYDVRFIYAHEQNWYLSIFEARAVIEQMLPGDLDVCGWELRKALRLFSKCNLALNEWLGSPIVYAAAEGFREQLLELMPNYFNPIAAMHHYRSMAETALQANYADGKIGIKKLFYVLRPLLACRWIEHRQSQPPTALPQLRDNAWVDDDEQRWITQLLIAKADAAEAELTALPHDKAAIIQQELERYKNASAFLSAPGKVPTRDLDEILRQRVWSFT